MIAIMAPAIPICVSEQGRRMPVCAHRALVDPHAPIFDRSAWNYCPLRCARLPRRSLFAFPLFYPDIPDCITSSADNRSDIAALLVWSIPN